MKYKKFKKSDKISLQNKITVYKKERLKLKFKRFGGNKINTSRLKQLKNYIAKIKTLLNSSI